MSHDVQNEMPASSHATLRSYMIGIVASFVLTLSAYFLVTEQYLSKEYTIYAISTLGLIQAVVQLYYFLHLGSETHPRWNLVVFLFMFMVLLIVVIGSLWIMAHLNYNMVPEIDPKTILQKQRLFG